MSTKHMKWYFLTGSILGILISIFGCATITTNLRYPEKSSIRTLSIQIDEDQYEELFVQMREFSEKHHLEFYLSFYNNKETFYIFMDEESLVIRALSQPTLTSNLNFRFFEKDPTNPPTQETVDGVFNDLKTFIGEIPNVTIVEEK